MGDKIVGNKVSSVYNIVEMLNMLKIPYTRLGKGTCDNFDAVVRLAIAKRNNLVFCNKPNSQTLPFINDNPEVIVLMEEKCGKENSEALINSKATVFLVDNPRLVVSKILSLIYPNEDVWEEGIHPTAVVHPNADIDISVSIGRYAIIGKCSIGADSRVGAFTIIKNDTVIGKKVTIREFCHIGGCGFGIVRVEQSNRLTRFPHIGRVVVEDEVELFPYVNVDRGALGDTTVKRGTKIDHYSHIGHNCTVGENTIITARTVMCGGSSIGDNSWSGVGVIIKEKVSVGNNVTIGLGAVVTKNVKDGDIVAGVPARSIKGEAK